MGRPLKLTEFVNNTTKVGIIGNTAITGNQVSIMANISAADGGAGTAAAGHIRRQVGSKQFVCNVGLASGACTLTTGAPVAGTTKGSGQIRITATDSAGGTYYISKISSKRVTVVQGTGTQFASNTSVGWTFLPATVNKTVTISSS